MNNTQTANQILTFKRNVKLVIFKTNADGKGESFLNDADDFVDRLLRKGFAYHHGTKNYSYNSTPFCNFNYLGLLIGDDKKISHISWDTSIIGIPVAFSCNITKVQIYNDKI